MKKLILDELHLLIKEITSNRKIYGDNDIRPAFYDGYFQILRTFYCAYYQLDTFNIVNQYYEIYEVKKFNEKQLVLSFQGHRNLLNSFLIINCWSNFELFISLFCEKVLEEDKICELLEIDYRRIKKILKSHEISNEEDSKLKSYIKNHLAHVPIGNKYGKLLKSIESYPDGRERKDDREFLELFGSLRNGIHSNYIYYGSIEKVFKYNDETFLFKPGQLIDHKNLSESSIFLLTQNLKKIVQLIIDNIMYSEEIPDPSFDLIY
jgi:hypothetical protein